MFRSSRIYQIVGERLLWDIAKLFLQPQLVGFTPRPTINNLEVGKFGVDEILIGVELFKTRLSVKK